MREKKDFALGKNGPLVVLIALFLVLGGIYSLTTPVFEAGDELWHYPFVQFLASGHGLPIQDPARKDLWEQEGGQPPLYYVLSAAATFWIDTRDLPDRLWRNAYAKVGIPLAFGDKNLIVHTDAEDFPWHDTTLAVHLIRFLSLLLGAGTVVLTYLLAREMELSLPLVGDAQHKRTALFAAAFVALTPMFLFISASVNNDSLAVLLASLALLLIVRLRTRGLNKRRSLIIGIACGLAALTKVSDLALLPLALLVVAWIVWRQQGMTTIPTRIRRTAIDILVPAILIVVPSLLIAGWWYARNYLLYGDPLALNVWLKISGGRAAAVTLPGLLAEFQGFRISYWGNFGGVNLIAADWVYFALDVIVIVAVLGLLLAAWRRRIPAAIWIPALWLAIVFASLVRWTLLTYASQGRLIFPAIGAVGVLMAYGLSSFWFGGLPVPGLKYWEMATSQPVNLAAAIFLLVFAAASPFLLIVPAYRLPVRLAGDAAVPNPVHITYEADGDRPELAGYEIGRSVRAGEELPLALYWRTGDGVGEDLYVYIHVYDASGQLVGQWDALPGNGLYPTRLWQPNQLIVDRYRVPVSSEALGPQVGHVEVGLTHIGSTVPLTARDPSGAAIVPTIARFKIAAPPRSVEARPALFKFGNQFDAVNLHLSGARGGREFEIDPGHTANTPLFGGDVLQMALTLRAATAPVVDYTVFVHLVDSRNRIVVQQDVTPGSTAYPTSFWDVGEEVDSHFDLEIPDNLAPGDYQLEVGLYNSKDGARLPVSGNAIGDLRAAGDRILLSPLPIGK